MLGFGRWLGIWFEGGVEGVEVKGLGEVVGVIFGEVLDGFGQEGGDSVGMVFDVFLVVVGEGNWIGVAVGAVLWHRLVVRFR